MQSKTGDSETLNELAGSAPASLTGDNEELPQGVNLNINLSPQQPLPDAKPELGGSKMGDDAEDMPEWAKAIIMRLDKLEGQTTDSDDPDKNKELTGDEDEDLTTITGDSAYRAEVIIPGIDLTRKVKPTAFKREVLAAADKALVRQIVGDADIRKLPKQSVELVFTAVSELAKGRNTRTTTGDAKSPLGTPSISDLNKANAEFWANRKG